MPWELLRDPATDAVLALRARAFVRADPHTPRTPVLPESAETVRVLLVICRPAGGVDVPFRSVASHLVRLSREAREAFQLDVLRPPTFAQLTHVLDTAKQRGQPYHVVEVQRPHVVGTLSPEQLRPRVGTTPLALARTSIRRGRSDRGS